jgi:hypothetical protein
MIPRERSIDGGMHEMDNVDHEDGGSTEGKDEKRQLNLRTRNVEVAREVVICPKEMGS